MYIYIHTHIYLFIFVKVTGSNFGFANAKQTEKNNTMKHERRKSIDSFSFLCIKKQKKKKHYIKKNFSLNDNLNDFPRNSCHQKQICKF